MITPDFRIRHNYCGELYSETSLNNGEFNHIAITQTIVNESPLVGVIKFYINGVEVDYPEDQDNICSESPTIYKIGISNQRK